MHGDQKEYRKHLNNRKRWELRWHRLILYASKWLEFRSLQLADVSSIHWPEPSKIMALWVSLTRAWIVEDIENHALTGPSTKQTSVNWGLQNCLMHN